jgi:hypothetical protein
MASVTEIRKFVSDYLDRSVSGEVFSDGITKLVYELAPDSDPAVIDISRALNTKIAEVHLGLVSDYEFRSSLIPYSDKTPTVRTDQSVAVSPDSHFELLELVGH